MLRHLTILALVVLVLLAGNLPRALPAEATTLTATGSATVNNAFAYQLTTQTQGDITFNLTWTQNGAGWDTTFTNVSYPEGCIGDTSPWGSAGSPGYRTATCANAPAGDHEIVFSTWAGSVSDISLTINTPDGAAASTLRQFRCNPKSRKC